MKESSTLSAHDPFADPLGDLRDKRVPEGTELVAPFGDSGSNAWDTLGLPFPISVQPCGKPISQQTHACRRRPVSYNPEVRRLAFALCRTRVIEVLSCETQCPSNPADWG